MQTTLDVDSDVLAAAEEISLRTQSSAGKVLSNLARQALAMSKSETQGLAIRNGFEIIPGQRPVTLETVR